MTPRHRALPPRSEFQTRRLNLQIRTGVRGQVLAPAGSRGRAPGRGMGAEPPSTPGRRFPGPSRSVAPG